jgi:hypothetical protein
MELETAQKAKIIAEKFVALSEYAEKLAFPDYRRGIFESKKLDGYRPISKFIFNVSYPFSMNETPSLVIFIGWSILYFLELIAVILGIIYLYPSRLGFGQFFPPTATPVIVIIVFSVLLIGLPVSIVSYTWGWETIRAQKYPWWVKVLILALIFWIINSISLTPLTGEPIQHVWDWDVIKTEPIMAIIALGMLVIPASMYLAAIVLDSILFVLFLIRTLFGGIASVHDPRPIEMVLKLANEEIPASKSGAPSWKLSQLHRDEIITLRQWAEANREGSEKRTIPASIIAALVGVTLTSDVVRGALDTMLSGFANSVTGFMQTESTYTMPANFGVSLYIVFPIMLLLLLSFAKKLIALFRNIVAQNLIVEACILTEYAIQTTSREKQNSLWGFIRNILMKIKI